MSLSNATGSAYQPPQQAPSIPPLPDTSLPDTTVRCEDRWQVYHRLQELEIDCQCAGFQPLKVHIQTPTEALQLWSIVRRVSQPRQLLVATLNQSWQRPCAK